MSGVDWEQSEPGLGFATDEAKRLLRRARARRWWVVAIGLLCAGAYGTRQIMMKRLHEGRLVRFEMIEPGIVVASHLLGPAGVAVAAVLIFLVTSTLAGFLLGAFSSRVRQAADVRRLGLRVLGAMPAYPGDSLGSLEQRRRAEDRLR